MTAEEKENKKSISAAEYIRTTFHSSDRLAVLVRNRSRGETIQRITTSARIVEPAFQEWMHFKNEKESCDIYVGMNTLKPEARTRTKEDIQTIRHLYVDIDHDGPAALAKIQQSNLVPSPNYTVNTSPDKFQVVWRVENISPEQAEALQRAMARKFGGDPAATDSTRVLRLPSFLNRKYDTEFQVQAEKHTDRVYHLQDFRLRTEPVFVRMAVRESAGFKFDLDFAAGVLFPRRRHGACDLTQEFLERVAVGIRKFESGIERFRHQELCALKGDGLFCHPEQLAFQDAAARKTDHDALLGIQRGGHGSCGLANHGGGWRHDSQLSENGGKAVLPNITELLDSG